MIEWINSEWTISIAGGILSGVAVTWISRRFLEKKDDRELREKTTAASREIIYAIRPGIAEGIIPTPEILERLADSTARKYELERKQLCTGRQIVDDLIKEVMDSSFISSIKKIELSQRLLETTTPQRPNESSPQLELSAEFMRAEIEAAKYRNFMKRITSMTVGVVTSLTTGLMISLIFKGDLSIGKEVNWIWVLIPTALSLFLLAIYTGIATRRQELLFKSSDLEFSLGDSNPNDPKEKK